MLTIDQVELFAKAVHSFEIGLKYHVVGVAGTVRCPLESLKMLNLEDWDIASIEHGTALDIIDLFRKHFPQHRILHRFTGDYPFNPKQKFEMNGVLYEIGDVLIENCEGGFIIEEGFRRVKR